MPTPRNIGVIDKKPTNVLVDKNTEKFYTVIINANQYVGFGGLTYTEAGTVSSSKSP